MRRFVLWIVRIIVFHFNNIYKKECEASSDYKIYYTIKKSHTEIYSVNKEVRIRGIHLWRK